MTDEPDRAREALASIPPSLPRDEWVRVGMAAHAAGLELADFDAWSAGGDSYREADCRATWRSFKPGAGIGPGTLYRIASEHGYSRPINGHGKAPARPVAPSKPARPGMGAAEVWKRCQPATAGHAYIAAKQGLPDGLRVVPEGDPLRIAGQSVAGWLAVPVVPLGGSPDEPVSLQFIPPQGKKLNLPGAHVAGVFTVGELLPGGTVQLCEGIGQAWACWKATGAAAVVCFGWGRVRAVAAELRQRDASARLLLCPDAGKESDAERIAAELGAAVARMPEGSPPNFDANDFAQAEGFDALEVLLSGASEPQAAADSFSDWPDGRIDRYFEAEPPPVAWFAHQRLLAGRGHLLAGVGGSSKTRILYHLGMAAALGRLPWDWDVSATGSAALFLTEDVAAQVHRVLFQMGRHLSPQDRRQLAERMRVFPLAGRRAILLELNGNALQETRVYDWLMRQIDALPKPVAFVGIDPALGVTEGDELSPAHQRRLGEMTDRIGIQSGACMVLAAHATKGLHLAEELGSHSARGSGAITDAVRGEFTVRNMTADEARRFGIDDRAERQLYVQLAATKGNELPPEAYAPVWLKRNTHGGLEQVSLEQVTRGTVGARELRALELMKAHTEAGDLTLKFWRGQCEAAGVIPASASQSAKEKAMERIRDALKAAGMVETTGRGLWKPT